MCSGCFRDEVYILRALIDERDLNPLSSIWCKYFPPKTSNKTITHGMQEAGKKMLTHDRFHADPKTRQNNYKKQTRFNAKHITDEPQGQARCVPP